MRPLSAAAGGFLARTPASASSATRSSARPGGLTLASNFGLDEDNNAAEEAEAWETLLVALRRGIVDDAVRVLSLVDMDRSPSDEKIAFSAMQESLTDHVHVSLYNSLLRQRRSATVTADVLAASSLQLLRRVVGLNSPALSGSNPPSAISAARTAKLSALGMFGAVATALSLHTESLM